MVALPALDEGVWRLRRPLVALLAVLPYLALLGNPLLHDAPLAVEQNPAVREGGPVELLTADFWGVPLSADHASGSWRPLVLATWAAQTRISGTAPAPLHAVDLLLHAVLAVMVLGILERLAFARPWPLVAAALYAVHPLHVDAVASVVGRADLLAGLALLAALALHDAAGRSKRPWAFEIAAAAALGAGMLSKEYAVVFPFVLVGFDVARRAGGFQRAGSGRGVGIAGAVVDAGMGRDAGSVDPVRALDGPTTLRELRRARRTWPLFLAVLVIYLAARFALIGELGGVRMLTAADHPLFDAPAGVRLAMASRLTLLAWGLVVWPSPLNHFYRFGTLPIVGGFANPLALAGLVLLVALTAFAFAILRRRGDGRLLCALALFYLPLAPSLNTVALSGVLFAERFMVLPLVGAAIALAWALGRVLDGAPARWRGLAVACALVAIVALGTATASRVSDWSSAERLARSSLAGYPNGAEVWEELGVTLGAQGRLDEAADALGRSVELRGTSPRALARYGTVLGRLGRHDDASAAWRRSVEVSVEMSAPDIAAALGPLWLGLGEAELQAGRPGAALEALGRAATLLPADPRLPSLVGHARLLQAEQRLAAGDRAGALADAEAALATGAVDPAGWLRAALVARGAGREDLALAAAKRAVEADPGLPARVQDDPAARALLDRLD